MRWAKMPCGWQTNPAVHESIRRAPIGEAIAALKLYLVLCTRANFHATEELPEPGCVRRSLVQLCELAGVSKPMAIAGLRHLEAWALVTNKGGKPSLYQLQAYDVGYWTKLPATFLNGGPRARRVARIARLSNRHRNTQHGLQLYIYLASIRDRRSEEARVTYERIGEVTGLNKNAITGAISLLIAHQLISVREGQVDPATGKPFASNVYRLYGTDRDPIPAAPAAVPTPARPLPARAEGNEVPF